MYKRLLSIILVLIMLVGLFPVFSIPAIAATGDDDISDMNALQALGIDTSIAPKGYDSNSTENPYGTDIVPLGTVWELYTVGLTEKATYSSPSSNEIGTHDADADGNLIEHRESNANDNTLQSSLYGNALSSFMKVSDVLGGKITHDIASGKTTQTADYVRVGNGTNGSGANNGTGGNYMTSVTDRTTSLTIGGNNFNYALSSVASANFNGNKESQQGQIVMAYTADSTANGGLYLRFGDADGSYGASAMELISPTKKIGNPDLKDVDGKPVEDFAANPYQLKNYLQVATGDWDNNGVDEVAVYVPEYGYSRLLIYKFQGLESDKDAGLYKPSAYTDTRKWALVWSYYFNEGDVVSNMVSFTSGDVNKDGIDDLAATWGYYYGPGQNKGSRAVVMFGGNDKTMLKSSQEFSLTYGNSNIVRAAFAYGDLAGGGEPCLILAGQSDADLKAGNLNTRYVALYNWDGRQFTYNVYKNFDLFSADDSGNLIYGAMARNKVKVGEAEDKYIFYSSPLCVANTAVVSQGITQKTSVLYFDSLLIAYTDSGLDIAEAWDTTGAMQPNTSQPVSYVEYDAVGGDVTGQTGAGLVATMQQTIGDAKETDAHYKANGTVPDYKQGWYYKNWWNRLWGKKTYYWYLSGTRTVSGWTSDTVAVYTPGKTYMVVVSPNESSAAHYIGEDSVVSKYSRTETDVSMTICLANTDSDTSYMKYSGDDGDHYFLYTDPAVLAALASPPYFSDLLDRDDLSGNYAESTTGYSSTTGSGSGSTKSTTLTVGAYVSFEHDFTVFGVKVASVEAEATVTAGFTWETEKTSTLEQTITYNATSGEDMIALYSIPMEVFKYTTYTPNGNGTYSEVVTAVNIPHEAAVRLMSLEEYEMIAADYDVLPKISNTVMTHELGNPTSYPKLSDIVSEKYNGYSIIAQYDGKATAVGYSSSGGGASVTQEIAMSKETSSVFTVSGGLETKAGAGVGDFIVGIVAGVEGGAGKVEITTEGSSFSGDMQNMPIEAQEFGYAMNWRIFAYSYKQGKMSFPVVSYLVSDVTMPPTLPADFDQSVSETTDTSVTLSWSYDKTVTAFQIYRYYEFPEGTGSYLVSTVPFSAATGYDAATGTYTFSYTENNLSPYTDYLYQIQTVGIGTQNNKSIYSEPISVRTRTALGDPIITVNGLVDGTLLLYPDTPSSVSVTAAMSPEDVERKGEYKSVSYQWQRIINGNWESIQGATAPSHTFKNTSASDATAYRCRLNIVYYDATSASQYYISAYSQAFTTAYSKRTSTGDLAVTVSGDTLKAKAQLWSANTGHSTAPTGTVTIAVTGSLSDGTTYDYSKTVALAPDGSQFKNGETKNIYSGSLELTGLKSGVYIVSYIYSGNRYFKSYTLGDSEVGIVGAGSLYQLGLASSGEAGARAQISFTYGDSIYPAMSFISKDLVGDAVKNIIDAANFKFISYESYEEADKKEDLVWTHFPRGAMTPSVGTYIMQATYGADTATQTFTVTPRDIAVEMPTYSNISAGDVLSTQPAARLAAGSTMAQGETFAMDNDSANNTTPTLRLGYEAYNSAGTKMELDASTPPGHYTIIACKSSSSSPQQSKSYENYNITYVPGVYTIIGATYLLEVKSSQYTDDDGIRTVGRANISNGGLSANYPSGSSVTLVAYPHVGYKVKKWAVYFHTDKKEKYNDASHKDFGGAEDLTTLYLTTEAQNVTVTVTYERANHTLATSVSGSGTITCDDSNFTSGGFAYSGGDFEFTAAPAPGYHFSRWIVYGATTSYPAGHDNGDGTNTLRFTMGTANTTVQAVFVRESYTLTLDGNIRAWYMKPGQTIGDPAVKTYITSGGTVPGGSEITVEPMLGYSKNGDWVVNTEPITESDDRFTLTDSSCKFTLTDSMAVSLATTRGSFDVGTSTENGSVTIAVESIAKEGTSVTDVLGGSKVSFTARASRGYVFDYWTVGGKKLAELTDLEKENVTASANADGSALLTIARLDANKDVAAVFTVNTPYTFTASLNNASRGTLSYTLRDIYGGIAKENIAYTGALSVYAGESIRLIVTPASGNMVEHWVVDGSSAPSTDKYKDFSRISSSMAVEVQLKASTGYKVLYSSGSGGQIFNATADGKIFNSGDILSGGTAMVLTAAANSGYMVEKWTRIIGLNSSDEAVITDADGVLLVDPVYSTLLDGHYQYKAHFTALSEYNVSTLGITGGEAVITYATPIAAGDGAVSDAASYDVRDGGTVRIKFTASDGYATDAVYLKNALSGCRQVVKITETIWGRECVAEIKGVSEALTISECTPFYTPIPAVTYGPLRKTGEDSGHGKVEAKVSHNAMPYSQVETSTSSCTINVYRDGQVVLTAVPDTGYKFVSWTVNGTEFDASAAPAGVTVSGRYLTLAVTSFSNDSYDIKALFELAGDKVNFSAENYDAGDAAIHGTVSAYSDATSAAFVSGAKLAVSSTLTFTAIPDAGYHVEGWYRDGAPVGGATGNTYSYYYDVTLDNPGADIVVKFIRDSYTISYSAANGDIKIAGDTKTGTEQIIGDTVLTLSAVAKDGYKFVRWTVNGESAGESDTLTVTVTEDTAIIAVFEPHSVTYTVTYSLDGNGTLNAVGGSGQNIPSGASRAAESTVVFTAKPNAGYRVKCWSVNGLKLADSSELTSYTFGPLLADVTVLVEFEPIPTYTITLGAYTHGTVTAKVNGVDKAIVGGEFKVNRYDDVVLTAKPSKHYAFESWSGDLSGTGTVLTIEDVTESKSISASFTAAEYIRLTVSKEDLGGNINMVKTLSDGEEKNVTATVGTQIEIVAGSTVTVEAEPNSGKMVKSWKVNDSAASNLSKIHVLTNLLTDTTVKVAFEDYNDWTIPTGDSDTFFTASTISRTPEDATPVTTIRDRGNLTFKIGINANFVLTSLKVNDFECMVNNTVDYGRVSVTPNSDGTYNVTVSGVTAEIKVTATEYKLQPNLGAGSTPESDVAMLTAAAEDRLSGEVKTDMFDVSMMKNDSGVWVELDETKADKIIRDQGGVDLYLPYPTGVTYETSEGYEFSVAHLITTGARAGTIEHLTATPTPEWLKITITSM